MSLSLHIAFHINVTSARVLTEGVIIDQEGGILESSIPVRPFVNNVYRRSLALALAPPPRSPPPVFPVYNLTRSPLTAALYYLNAWNRLDHTSLSDSRGSHTRCEFQQNYKRRIRDGHW